MTNQISDVGPLVFASVLLVATAGCHTQPQSDGAVSLTTDEVISSPPPYALTDSPAARSADRQPFSSEPAQPADIVTAAKAAEPSPPVVTVVVDPAEPVTVGIVHWPHITVDLENRWIDIEGFVGINAGWLEQVVCTPRTRVHESVIAALARPSHIHAALLLLGLEPGKPGRWRIDDNDPAGLSYIIDAPQGSAVRATVLFTDSNGMSIEVPVNQWIRDHNTGMQLPDKPWIFGGSFMHRDYSGREVYAADSSGSIMGLVTFGDELLGWSDVLPDQASVLAPEWEADTEAMPPFDTPVTLRLIPVDNRE